jgi:hypothetical protein
LRGPWKHPALKARLDLEFRGAQVYIASQATTEILGKYAISVLLTANDYRQLAFENMLREKEYFVFGVSRKTFAVIPEAAMQLAQLFESQRPVRAAIAEFAAANGLDTEDGSE